MNTQIDLQKLRHAAESLRTSCPDARPCCGVMLGSGWGEAVSDFSVTETIPYEKIPGLGTPGVAGHCGKMLRAQSGGKEVWIFQGRRHWYEGEGWTPVIMPVFLLHAFGAETVLLTNASGGIREDCGPGTLTAISDHINMLGANPLTGPHREALGPRFPDQSEIYCKELRKLLLDSGAQSETVYVAAMGPSFETPAEIRAFRNMGADIVGMSTAPEATVANALGLKVAGLSCVCNWAAGISPVPLTHEDVNRTAKEAMPKMRKTLKHFIGALTDG